MKKILFSLFILAIMMGACTTREGVEKITVASEQGDCIGVAPMKCFLIKHEGQDDWEFVYGGIDGFKYEPGYEYVIEIRKEKVDNPAADQSTVKYVFLNELSRKKMVSDGLPGKEI